MRLSCAPARQIAPPTELQPPQLFAAVTLFAMAMAVWHYFTGGPEFVRLIIALSLVIGALVSFAAAMIGLCTLFVASIHGFVQRPTIVTLLLPLVILAIFAVAFWYFGAFDSQSPQE